MGIPSVHPSASFSAKKENILNKRFSKWEKNSSSPKQNLQKLRISYRKNSKWRQEEDSTVARLLCAIKNPDRNKIISKSRVPLNSPKKRPLILSIQDQIWRNPLYNTPYYYSTELWRYPLLSTNDFTLDKK